jgi:cytoskeleton protein RodZ
MASLGSFLRESRQRRGLGLEEMARATRVAARYLEALETDDFAALPAPVFTKGFIRAYCQTLGLDPDDALTRYHEQTGEPVVMPGKEPAPPREMADTSRSRGTVLVSFVLLVVLGAALFGVTLALQPGREGRRARPVPPDRTVESVPAAAPAVPAEPPVPSASASAEPPAAPPVTPRVAATPSVPAPTAPSAGGRSTTPPPAPQPAGRSGEAGSQVVASVAPTTVPYRLVARVSEPTWIRVRTDDGRSSEETIPAGQTREWVSSTPFVLTVGNAGGVTLELNGRTLPPLGASGAVIPRLIIPPAQQ